MAKQKFVHFVPRDKPPKLGPGRHKKNLNKSEKRQQKTTRYKGQADESFRKYINLYANKKYVSDSISSCCWCLGLLWCY